MSDDKTSPADQDLLARLNALKKTHIDLDDKQYKIPVTVTIRQNVDPLPARALHDDLVSRFKSLTGTKTEVEVDDENVDDPEHDFIAGDDNRTIEELLAELGGEGAWNIEKDEATQIDDLLRSANVTLRDITSQDDEKSTEGLINGNSLVHDLPSVDVQFNMRDHQAGSRDTSDVEDQADNDTHRKSKMELEAEINREADDIIAKVRDELKKSADTPTDSGSDNGENGDGDDAYTSSTLPAAPAFELPTTPSKDPKASSPSTSTAAESDLAARFASLSLPTNTPSSLSSFPLSNTNTTFLPSAPSTKPGTTTTATARFGASTRYEGHTADEIDSWCTICLEDATLRCLGCDGDLYCAKCWIEAHRGPDAGYEERKHRALEYRRNMDDREEKKEPKRRRKVAA